MSHKATKWVFWQRGLKPGPRVVLLCLAEHYNPDFGCFPSQELIAFECEISRASVNTHLDLLERRGLVSRISSVDPVTYRQRPTRYHLAFEDGFRPVPGAVLSAVNNPVNRGRSRVQKIDTGPCPKTGKSRVQNLDTNLVKDNNRKTRGQKNTSLGPPVEGMPKWSGDPAIREAVANDVRYGEGFARSYIDTAKPDGSGGMVAFSGFAFQKLSGCAALSGIRVKPP